MTALIVIFITLSLMGSALWVLPPKKDRERMALRMQARQCGLTVQLISVHLPDKWDKITTTHKVAVYSHYRPKPMRTLSSDVLFVPYEVWKYRPVSDGWWSSAGVELPDSVKSQLEDLGDAVIGIKLAQEYVAFYWHENADESVLAGLSELVKELSKVDRLS